MDHGATNTIDRSLDPDIDVIRLVDVAILNAIFGALIARAALVDNILCDTCVQHC